MSTDQSGAAESTWLTSEPLACLFGEGILATEYVFDKRTRIMGGCLYTKEGLKIGLSERHGEIGGKNVETRNPESIHPDLGTPVTTGRSVYLGHFMGRHYGHFLLESLSAAWALEEIGAVDHIVYHPFQFGTQLHDFSRHLLSAVGIDPDRIEFIQKACRFECMTVPQRLFKLSHSAHVRLRSTYARVTARFAGTGAISRIYLSRGRLPPERWRIRNEQEVEHAFRRWGFAIVYPEELTLPEQVALYANCSVLAGVAGSALHNIVFCRPGSRLIHICDSRKRSKPLRTQLICNALAQAECHNVPFNGIGPQDAVALEAIERVLLRLP